MKTLRPVLALGLLALAAFTTFSFAAEKEKEEKSSAVGSIRPEGKPGPAALAALAKIPLATALKAALAAVPGSVIKAELEVEDGNLQYSFEIVGADKKVTEVEIDAGNGKVLDIDKG
jgi:uncharacterized membrane protein YkoI